MNIRFFNPGLEYLTLKPEIDIEINRVLSAGDLILRKDVEKFEENLAGYVGTKYAVALNSGTDAIKLSLKALGIGQGSIVAVPAHTFKATAGAVLDIGATPKIFDMDEGFMFKRDIQAIIPVHIAGTLSNTYFMTPIPIIEDACQALGAIRNPVTYTQCWSFYPAKILGAYGDAGAITTNREDVYDYVMEARNHFKYSDKGFGVNSRMDNLQAAILNVKFKYLHEYLARREEVAIRYKALHESGVTLPNYQQGRVWQDYIIRTDKRDALHKYLKENGVETLKNEYPFSTDYPKPPLAKRYEAETLRLPCNPYLTNDEVDYIIEKTNEFYSLPKLRNG